MLEKRLKVMRLKIFMHVRTITRLAAGAVAGPLSPGSADGSPRSWRRGPGTVPRLVHVDRASERA